MDEQIKQQLTDNLSALANDQDLTKEDVQSAVESALQNYQLDKDSQQTLTSIDDVVKSIDGRLKVVTDRSNQKSSDTDVVYTVKLDSGQLDTAKTAVRIFSTEGLLIVVMLSTIVGISIFRILSERWH